MRPVDGSTERSVVEVSKHNKSSRPDDQTRRISLSSGPGESPYPPPRSREHRVMLSRALAVAVVALLWELVVRWRRPQNTLPSNGNSARIFGAGMVCSWVLLCMGKSAAEEALSVKVCQKLREKLEDSFKGGKSTVSETWVRTGMATEVGFGLVVALPTSTTAHHADKESSGADSGEAGGTTTGVPPLNTAPGHLLAMKWVFLRFKLASFLPWSDVRRIPLVRVGGLSINVTESLSSSKGRKHNKTSGSIGDSGSGSNSSASGMGDSIGDRGSGGNSASGVGDSSRGSGGGGGGGYTSRHDETDNFPSADWLQGREQQDLHEKEGSATVAATAMGRAGAAGGRESTSDSGGGNQTRKIPRPPLLSQQSSLFDKMDSWAHQGRRASQRRSSHVESDVSGSGNRGDGYEWERVAQATLEHAFGHEFTAKYQMYTEEAASIMRRLSRIFVNLMKRYVLGEIVLQDMSIQLSAAVWRDLTSSFFQWEGASVVRELLPARGVEFRFDVSLTASEMGCASGSRTALEIVTALTKRTMLQLGRVVLSEARRALFNRESVVEILVNSLIHKDGGSAAAAVATAAAATARVEKSQKDGVGAPGEGGGEGELRRVGDGGGRRSGVTLVGVLAKGVATIAERKRVAELLTVLKHALFKAITINAGGDDPDEGNKGLAALLANTEVDRGSGLARKTCLTSSSSASNLAGVSNSTGEGGCEETGKVSSSGVVVPTTATAISTGNADPNSSGGGRRPRRRWSGSGAGGGGSGGGFGSGGGGGQSIRRRGSRGFRDVEGEAIEVAAKVSELVRSKDLVEALKIVRLVQVAPLLEELASYTFLGPQLRKRKIDVDHMIDGTDGISFGDIMDRVLHQLEIAGVTGSEQLVKRLRGRAARDYSRLRAKTGIASTVDLTDEDIFSSAVDAAPGAIEEARLVAAMAAQFGHALTAEITAQDVETASKAVSVLQGILSRRKALKAREASTAGAVAADAADAEVEVLPGVAGAAADGDGGRGRGSGGGTEGGEGTGKWNLEQEVELLSKDPEVSKSLLHATERLRGLARVAGVYVDTYMALSVLEFGFGGLLQRLPRLLPVVQTTIQKKGFTIKISNLNLGGVVFPRSDIRFSFQGTSLPPHGSTVETNTPFGRGRVVRYMKRTHSLCVELLSFPLRSGQYARAFVQPGDVVVIQPDQDKTRDGGGGAAVASTAAAAGAAEGISASESLAQPPGLLNPDSIFGEGDDESSRPSLHTRAAAKTILAASSLHQRLQDRRRRSADGSGGGGSNQRQRQGRKNGGGGPVESFGVTADTYYTPAPPPPKPAFVPAPGDDGVGPGTHVAADNAAAALPPAADDGMLTGVEPLRSAYAEGVAMATGPDDKATGISAAAGAKRHARGRSAGSEFASGAGGGEGALDMVDEKRRGSEIIMRGKPPLSQGALPPPLPPKPKSAPSPATATVAPADVHDGIAAGVPGRKTRTWPVRAESQELETGSRSGDASGGSAAEGGEGDTSPGGIAGGILGSGVWKKAYSAATNAAATAIAVNNDLSASATAAAANFANGGGVRWMGNRVGDGGRDAGDASRSGDTATVEHQEREEMGDTIGVGEEEGGEREAPPPPPPYLSITVGNVSCFLPDVNWSVQMQQKRFLRVGDSGYINVWLEGVSLSLSLDPGAGVDSLFGSSRRPSQTPPPPPPPPPPAAPRHVPGTSAAAAAAAAVGTSGGNNQGAPPRPLFPFVATSSQAMRSVSAEPSAEGADGGSLAERVGGGGGSSSALVDGGSSAAAGKGGGSGGSGGGGGRGGGGVSSKWSKLNSMSTALSKGTGKIKRRLKATTSQQQQQQQQQQLQRTGHHQPASTFFQPASSFFPPPSPTASSDKSDAFSSSSIPSTSRGRAVIPPLPSAATTAATAPEALPSSRSVPHLSILGDNDADGGSGSLVFATAEEFSPLAAAAAARRTGSGLEGDDWEAGEMPPCGISGGGADGFLKVTACSCKVGSIRIEVDGSKHDGIYNFLAKGLGDTIRDAVREAVEKAFAEEIGKLVEGINDRIAEIWSGSPPVSKKPARVVCAAVRAQDLPKGKTDLYVKVRLIKKDGTQLEKRSTAAVGPVATSAAMSIPIPSMAAISSNNSKDKEHEKKQKEKEAPARNPCWVGLDNDLSMNLPEEDPGGLSLVFEVWHSGTLANALVGSTRRVTMTEIEPPSPAAAAAAAAAAEAEEETEEDEERDGGATPATVLRDSDSNTLWLDLDSGGKLMVKLAVFGLAAHRRRTSLNRPGGGGSGGAGAGIPEAALAAAQNQRALRRWD